MSLENEFSSIFQDQQIANHYHHVVNSCNIYSKSCLVSIESVAKLVELIFIANNFQYQTTEDYIEVFNPLRIAVSTCWKVRRFRSVFYSMLL
jgi:hypothetical protein